MFLDIDEWLAGLVRLRPSSGEDRPPWGLFAVGVLILIAALVFLAN